MMRLGFSVGPRLDSRSLTEPLIRDVRSAPPVLLRVDGHHKFGLGHVYRCLNLAIALRDKLGLHPVFMTLEATLDSGVSSICEKSGIHYESVSGVDPYAEEKSITARIIRTLCPPIIVTDLLTPDPWDRDLLDDGVLQFQPVAPYIEFLKEFDISVVSITDEIDQIVIRPDVIIDHSCHYPSRNYDLIKETRFHLGPKYYLLGSDFTPYVRQAKKTRRTAQTALVMFGASDHNHYTMRATRQLLRRSDLDVTVLLGPAVDDRETMAGELKRHGANVLDSVPSVAELMFAADVAMTTGGNTCFEFSAVGTPIVTMCVRPRQSKNADFFQAQGCLINLGVATEIPDDLIGETMMSLIEDPVRREEMSHAGRRLVDGLGLARVTNILANEMAGSPGIPV